MRPRIYLSGPMKGLEYGKAEGWRLYAAERLKDAFEVLTPMRGEEGLKRRGTIQDVMPENLFGTDQGITVRDRNDILRSDVLLVNLKGATEVSVGTVAEIFWADILRKPIILVMEPGNVHNHPLIRSVAGFIERDLDKAIDIARVLVGAKPYGEDN